MFKRLHRNIQRNVLGQDPNYHDPYDDPAEQFYAQIYLKYLLEVINSQFAQTPVKILDIGCHTGRLAVPLAKAGHQVTGIDSSRFHIRIATQHAEKKGVTCQFLKGDGFRYLSHVTPGSFDLVLCTEVLYQRPDFRQCMSSLVQTLSPGGILATSHRTRFFYISHALRENDLETAQLIRDHSEGELWGSYFNWQSPTELNELYHGLNLELLLMRPIGVFTGNQGEGMSCFYDLSKLTPDQMNSLLSFESHDSDEFALMGRYIFCLGRKKQLGVS